jgi:hypothetical protein
MQVAKPPWKGIFAMTGMTAFLIAVGGVSMICFWLMTRVQNRAARRASSTADNSDSGSYDSGSGSWNIASWFSSENCSSDSSGTSGASGSWDSGGEATVEVAVMVAAAINVTRETVEARALCLRDKDF